MTHALCWVVAVLVMLACPWRPLHDEDPRGRGRSS